MPTGTTTMWKCASNCFLATFHKGLLKKGDAILSTAAVHPLAANSLLKFSPVLLERFSRYYGFYKDGPGKFSKGKKRRKNPNEKKTSFLGGFDNNVFDALTWSGVFALGYYFLQPFRTKTWRNRYENENCSTLSGYQSTVNYLIEAFNLKPMNYVLPEVKAAKTKQVIEDQALKENLEESKEDETVFDKAHEKVSGILSNWLGIQHMQTGNHVEALEYFIQSADKKNAAGMFNLGICHERGLGTSQNFERAAELYQRATDLGHAKAMYNLGVFYARGLGVDEIDIERARELFKAAANLGQKDAEKALKSEFSTVSNSLTHEEGPLSERLGDGDLEDLISRFLFSSPGIETANLTSSVDDQNISGDGFCDNDSGVLDLSPRLETDDLHL